MSDMWENTIGGTDGPGTIWFIGKKVIASVCMTICTTCTHLFHLF
jgi:hypothetical protein